VKFLRHTGYKLERSTYDELFDTTKNKRYTKYRDELTADPDYSPSLLARFQMSKGRKNIYRECYEGSSPPPEDLPETPPQPVEKPPTPWYHTPIDLSKYLLKKPSQMTKPSSAPSQEQASQKNPMTLVISPPLSRRTPSSTTEDGEDKRCSYKQEIIKKPLPRARKKPENTICSPARSTLERPPTPMRIHDQENKPSQPTPPADEPVRRNRSPSLPNQRDCGPRDRLYHALKRVRARPVTIKFDLRQSLERLYNTVAKMYQDDNEFSGSLQIYTNRIVNDFTEIKGFCNAMLDVDILKDSYQYLLDR